MKKLKITLSLLLLCGLIYSQTSEEIVSSHLNRAYASICDDDYYSVTHWMLGEATTENAESLNDIQDLNDLMLLDLSPCNVKLNGYWRRLYDIIASCNYVVDSATGMSEDARMIAEAKFIRSLAYFDLVKVFGPVPLYTETMEWHIIDYMSFPTYVFKERSSIAEVYTYIKADLTAAAADLPLRSALSSQELHRATAGAAKALLAKVYLYESSYADNYPSEERYSGLTADWDMVLTLCEEVIESGEYALLTGMNYDTWWNNSYAYPNQTSAFRYLFTAAGNYNSESIFEAAHSDSLEGYSFYGDHMLTMYTTPRLYKNEFGGTDQFGWGHLTPTQALEDAFAEETGDPTDDPRFQVTISKAGDSVLVDQDWFEIDFSMSPTDRYTRKFECSPDEFHNAPNHYYSSPLNIKVIRLADVYLWAAEAALKSGNSTVALGYINDLRNRTAGSGTSGYPQQLSTVTFDDIVHERQLEFAMEGHRYFDLVRWNLAEDTFNGLYNTALADNVSYTPGVNEVFPVPGSVVYQSEGVTAQNTGYYDLCPFLNSFDDLWITPDLDSTVINLEGEYSGSTFTPPSMDISISNNNGITAEFDLENNTLTFNYNNSIADGDVMNVTITMNDVAFTLTKEFTISVIEPDIALDPAQISRSDFGWAFIYGIPPFFTQFGVTNRSYGTSVHLMDGNRTKEFMLSKYTAENNTDYGYSVRVYNKSQFITEIAEKSSTNEFDILCVFYDEGSGEKHAFVHPVKISDVVRIVTVGVPSIEDDMVTIPISTSELYANDSTISSPKQLPPDINHIEIFLDIDTTKIKFQGISTEGTFSESVVHFVSAEMNDEGQLYVHDSLSAYIYGSDTLIRLQFQLLEGEIENTIVKKVGFIRENEDRNWDTQTIMNYAIKGEEPEEPEEPEDPEAINSLTKHDIKLNVFPSPATNVLHITTNLNNYSIQVFSMMGKLVYSEQGAERNKTIDLQNMPSGVYILKVNSSELSASSRFIKQ